MTATVDFSAGGYRFLPGVFQYSGGVAALSGHAIERVRFRTLLPLKQGFERIERLITAAGRPLTAFCACELRSPAPFTEQGFRTFNEGYVVTLQKWGLFDGKVNPVARSNVCPDIDPPPEPCFHAFSFTVADADAAPSFVIAGSAETREGPGSYSERTIRRGESSPEAGDAGLYRARPLSVPRRRDRAARRGARRADLALRAAACTRARIRGGLPLRRPGKRRVKSVRAERLAP
jgi:hypothetical protein